MNEKERALNARVEIRDWHDGFASRYLLVLIEPNGEERKLVHCADKRNALCYKNYLLSKMQSDLYGYLARNMGKGVKSINRR